ncbi:MAG: radical SAM protein [Fusobacteriaceae bacterium]|jgi:wyosine [tRNA(Phe)-imidazoG37] synthetase (radical SAM superfamily)|nr:radical SAM protein [Fusobacteriaceae bacterium]
MYRHLFGPVPSRRLGVSLGVDLVTAKTCNLDCVFCECGKTEKLTLTRGVFKDPAEVKKELKEALAAFRPNYVTFSGAGEPTLSLSLGGILRDLRQDDRVKTAVITNGLLFSDPAVREDLMAADLILTKINSVRKETFDRICRGAETDLTAFTDNLRAFCGAFPGEIYLETFIIEGLNDGDEEIADLTAFVKTLRITKWQLNTLARAGAEDWVAPASPGVMKRIREKIISLGYAAEKIEIIGEVRELAEKIAPDAELVKNMRDKREYGEDEFKKIFKTSD